MNCEVVFCCWEQMGEFGTRTLKPVTKHSKKDIVLHGPIHLNEFLRINGNDYQIHKITHVIFPPNQNESHIIAYVA